MDLNLNQTLQNKYPHLEMSVLKYSDAMKDNDSKRIDSEFFKKEYLENERLLRKLNSKELEDICYFLCNGDDCDREYVENGKIYIRTGDITENGLNLDTAVKIDSNFTSNINLELNDLLITRKGNYGKSQVINDEKILQCAISSEIFQLKLKDINANFVDIFLKTKYGQRQFAKHIHGVSNFSVTQDALLKFLIPLFPLEFQQQIEQMVRESHECLEQSKGLYREAEVLLYRELGLDPENPLATIYPLSGSLNISVRPLSQSLNDTGRLDSEYYQQKYDEIEKVIKNYRGGYVKIGDCFNQNKTTGNFILSKYNYIEIGDINIGTATAGYNLIPTDELPANAKIFLCNGDLLVSKVRPNRGAVAIVNIDESNFIASGAFTVLQEKNEIKKEVLMILLRTPLYKEWLLKFNVGTSYPVIKDEDILNLIIPKIAQQTQTQIAEKIKQSFTLRQKANDLLLTAKQTVETAIEKG